MRLICFPCAGSGGSFFSGWAAMLPPNMRLHPVTLPGRLERIAEVPFTSFDQAVAALADDLAPDCGASDIFFGHSLGALIAFEVARRNCRQGLSGPGLLVVAASVAPPALDPTSIARRSHAPDDKLVDEIQAAEPSRAAILNVHPELRALSLDALRADLGLAATYRYSQSSLLGCSILALSGTLDATASASKMANWRLETTGEFREREFVDGHMFVRGAALQIVSEIASWASQTGNRMRDNAPECLAANPTMGLTT